MRLHRGSSKDARGSTPPAETLPLSASSSLLHVAVEVTRGGRVRQSEFDVTAGTTIRSILRRAGEIPEGCAVLIDETPVPLDAPVERPLRLTVVPTFSGG